MTAQLAAALAQQLRGNTGSNACDWHALAHLRIMIVPLSVLMDVGPLCKCDNIRAVSGQVRARAGPLAPMQHTSVSVGGSV